MRPFALAHERDWLTARIAEQPDVPLRSLLAALCERGINVSYFAVWNIIDSTDLSYKKVCTPGSRIDRTSRAGGYSGNTDKPWSICAPCLLDQPINVTSFRVYIVVMDNLSSHKGKPIRQAIRGAEAKLIFLPPL